MSNLNLGGMKIAIIATDNFEEKELIEPRKALDNAGAETVLIAPKKDRIRGIQHDKPSETFTVDLSLEDANSDDFDAVMLPGGALNADKLRTEQKHWISSANLIEMASPSPLFAMRRG